MAIAKSDLDPAIEVRPVRGKKDIETFLHVPWKLGMKEDPNWVPPLLDDYRRQLDPRKSPFLDHGEMECFLALRNGVPVGVLVAPVIPALTDHEMPSIIAAAVQAGAKWAGYVPLRLPFGIKGLFETWLEQHFPDRKEKVLNRIRALRGGELNDPRFATRMRGEGIFAEQLESLFVLSCRKVGLTEARPELSTASFRVPSSGPRCMQKMFPF